VVHPPNLWNDFTDQLSGQKLGHSTHAGGGNLAAAESQRHVHLCGHGIEVAARRKHNCSAADHKPTVQLRQFLDGSEWLGREYSQTSSNSRLK
jgi:hypothetical protein